MSAPAQAGLVADWLQVRRPDTLPGSRLLRHEWRLAANLLFLSPTTWRERIRWFVGIPMLLVAGHFWLADVPPPRAAHVLAGWSFLLAVAATRFAVKRLDFHRSVGLLAAAALRPAAAWPYLALVVALGLSAAVLLVVILDPHALPACLAALFGGLLGAGLFSFAASFGGMRGAITRAIRIGSAWLKRPAAGIAAAALSSAAMLLAGRSLPPEAAAGVVSSATFTCGFLLTNANAGVVRFMTQSGFPLARTTAVHLRSLAVFAPLVSGAAYLTQGVAGIAMVAAVCGIAVAILCIRVLVYLRFDPRFADMVASLIVAAIALVAVYAPVASPVAAAVLIAVLWHKTRAKIWLLDR